MAVSRRVPDQPAGPAPARLRGHPRAGLGDAGPGRVRGGDLGLAARPAAGGAAAPARPALRPGVAAADPADRPRLRLPLGAGALPAGDPDRALVHRRRARLRRAAGAAPGRRSRRAGAAAGLDPPDRVRGRDVDRRRRDRRRGAPPAPRAGPAVAARDRAADRGRLAGAQPGGRRHLRGGDRPPPRLAPAGAAAGLAGRPSGRLRRGRRRRRLPAPAVRRRRPLHPFAAAPGAAGLCAGAALPGAQGLLRHRRSLPPLRGLRPPVPAARPRRRAAPPAAPRSGAAVRGLRPVADDRRARPAELPPGDGRSARADRAHGARAAAPLPAGRAGRPRGAGRGLPALRHVVPGRTPGDRRLLVRRVLRQPVPLRAGEGAAAAARGRMVPHPVPLERAWRRALRLLPGARAARPRRRAPRRRAGAAAARAAGRELVAVLSVRGGRFQPPPPQERGPAGTPSPEPGPSAPHTRP